MAGIDDISRYLARRVAGVLYPGGFRLPAIVNAPVKIYPGWPEPAALLQDIETGGVHVSVWPLPAERKVNSALGRPYRLKEKGTPTLQLTVNGSIITVSGMTSALTHVCIKLDNRLFSASFHAGKTAAEVADVLHAKLPRSFTIGPCIYVLMVEHISVSVTTAGTAVRELRRQIKDFQITVWAPTPHLRNRVGCAIDEVLSERCTVDLEDGAPAQLFYTRQFDTDTAENWHVYRRDLIFSINYATTQAISAPEVTDIAVTVNGHRQGH